MKAGRLEKDPEYWWCQAQRLIKDANILFKNNGSNDTIVMLCVDAFERAIKAVLAEKGLIDEDCRKHSLLYLTQKKSDIYKEFNQQTKDLIGIADTLHSDSAYPKQELVFNVWNEPGTFDMIVGGCQNAITDLERRYRGSKGTKP